jgi:hypothetical protein
MFFPQKIHKRLVYVIDMKLAISVEQILTWDWTST